MNREVENLLLMDVREAILLGDYGALEELSGTDLTGIIEPLLSDYSKSADWLPRDAIVFLLQDLTDSRLAAVMRHALDSPTVDTRAIVVCFLSGDVRLFETFIVGGFVDKQRVDAAIAKLPNVDR